MNLLRMKNLCLRFVPEAMIVGVCFLVRPGNRISDLFFKLKVCFVFKVLLGLGQNVSLVASSEMCMLVGRIDKFVDS